MRLSLEDRFEKYISRVPFSGCWLWTGFLLRDGYGGFAVNGRPVLAHRLAWRMAHGDIPNGLCVLHRCDVALCVNPEHLFLGTQRDNIADKVSKGRQAKGERHGMSKLTDAEVIAIMALRGRTKAKEVSALFGVTPERIWQLWGSH